MAARIFFERSRNRLGRGGTNRMPGNHSRARNLDSGLWGKRNSGRRGDMIEERYVGGKWIYRVRGTLVLLTNRCDGAGPAGQAGCWNERAAAPGRLYTKERAFGLVASSPSGSRESARSESAAARMALGPDHAIRHRVDILRIAEQFNQQSHPPLRRITQTKSACHRQGAGLE